MEAEKINITHVSDMSLKKLLTTEGVSTIKYLYVNIISVLSYNYYIVGDSTAIAIMEVDETSKKKFRIGTGLKIIKPKPIGKDTFLLDEPVMETKPMLLTKPDKLRLEELQKKVANLSKTEKNKSKYMNFKSICDENEENTVVDAVLVLVSSISRNITTQFGDYKICNVLDETNTPLSMNLYTPHLDALTDNKVFSITNLRKIKMINGEVRLSTTKFTKIKPANTDEEKLFHEYKVDKPVIDGCCIMYTDLACYKSCPKHNTKLNVDAFCIGCKKKIFDAENNFHVILHIETQNADDLIPVLIFKNNLRIDSQMCETKLEETIEQFVINKNVKIHFNKKGGNNIATKVEINDE